MCFWDPSLSGDALPCEEVYPEVADIKARAGGPVVEVGRMTIDPDLGNCSFKATIYAALV
jgi:hypothetical protein